MKKITVTESELREIVTRSLMKEGAVPPDDSLAKLGQLGPISGWDPTTRLNLLGSLVGGTGIASAWWTNVMTYSSYASATRTTADGQSIMSDDRFASDMRQFGTNNAVVLKALLNFAIVSVMCGKTVQVFPASGTPRPQLRIVPKTTYDMIQKAGSNNVFVYPNDALVKQCTDILSGKSIKTFDDPLFVTEILQDETAIKEIVREAKIDITSGPPSANTCLTSLPEAERQKYAEKQIAAVTQYKQQTVKASKDLSSEVYESYLYTPLLAPRVWLNPGIEPDSPLFTPWRMTWSACNLISQALDQSKKSGYSRDIAIVAMLTNLIKMIRTGTSINIFDAPGKDFAMGESESINEAAFFVGGVLLTEDKLRRVIRAALSKKLMLNISEGLDDLVPGAGALRVAARGIGAVVDFAETTTAAVARQSEELKDAGKAMSEYAISVRSGRIIQSVANVAVAEDFTNAIKTLQSMLAPIYRELTKTVSLDTSILGAAAKPNADELVSRLGIDAESAQKIADVYDLMIGINFKRASSADADVSSDISKINDLLRDLPRDAVLKVTTASSDASGLMDDLDANVAIQSAKTTIFRSTQASAAIAEMKLKSAAWLDARLSSMNPNSKIKFEVINESIVPTVPKFEIIPGSPASGATPAIPANVTFSSSERIPLSGSREALEQALKSVITGSSRQAIEKRTALIQQYTRDTSGITDAQIDALTQTSVALSRNDFYTSGIDLIINGAYTAAGSVLPKAVGNKTVVGLIEGAPETSKVTKLFDALGTLSDYTIGSDPSKGMLPYIPGLKGDQSLGWTTIRGNRIQAGNATKAAWDAIKSVRADMVPDASGAIKTGKGWGWTKITGFSAAYIAAFGYESAMIASRAKSQIGQRSLSYLAKGFETKAPSVSIGITKAINSKWGGLIGALTGGTMFSLLTAVIGARFDENLSQKSELGDSEFAKVTKTIMTDLTRGPIELRHGGVNLLSGGPLAVIVKTIVSAVADEPGDEDFDQVLASLDQNDPYGDAKKKLSDAVSNMYKNAILPDDSNSLLRLFPDLGAIQTPMGEDFDRIIQLSVNVGSYTKDIVTQAMRADPNSRTTVQNLAPKFRAAKAEIDKLNQEVDAFKAAKQSFSPSIEGAEELNNKEAIRLSIINSALNGLKSEGDIDISRFRAAAVFDTGGRENATEESGGNMAAVLALISRNSEFFDFTTTYLEFAGNPDPAVPLAAAAKGAYGLEFTGEITSAESGKIFKDLASLWQASGTAVAGALSATSQ